MLRDSLSSSDLTKVSRWIKAHNTLPVLRTERGEFVSHPHLVGQKLTEAWQDFFGRETAALNSDEVEAMVRGIDPYHAEVPILDPGELKSHVMRTANSAPGEDAYPLALLQAMPLQAWELLTRMFTAIENGGQWPTQLRSALVCAIPRADSGSVASPLKWRLISVTSHLYRAWGGLRAKQIGKIWLAKISPEGLFGGVPKKSAEDAAHTSSFWWDQASVMDIPLWSISMDASKCFDSIAPASIIEIATRLGAPKKAPSCVGQLVCDSRSQAACEGLDPGKMDPPQRDPPRLPHVGFALCHMGTNLVQACGKINREALAWL